MPEDSSLAADMDTLVMERHVKGWQGVFRTNPAFHLILAFFVGIVAGLGAIAFRRLIGLMHNAFFFGQIASRFDDLQHSAASFWGLGVVLVPVLIRPVVVLVKAIASSISIGSGGSVGREGPIIQIGAAFGSSLAQWLRLQEWQRLGLIAAGAGAGIAATFNTPVGGILFAIELMLVEVSARTLVPVMIATGTAAFVSRLFLGNYPSFIISQHMINRTLHQSAGAYAAYVLLGLLTGGAGLLFTNSLYWTEDRFEHWIKNPYARHAAGMLGVGLVIYFMITFTGHYYVEGVGYATVQDILDGVITQPVFLLLLLLLKILTFSVTLGSGGSGGVFSPALYVAAMLTEARGRL